MPQMTRSELVTQIGLLAGDPSNQRFSAAVKQAYIQKAQENFVLDTRALVDTQNTSVVAGTSSYALPSDVLDVNRVALNGVRLVRLAKFDLDFFHNQDWTNDAGTPGGYYVDLDPNNEKLILYPIPQAGDAGTSNLLVEYIKQPPALSGDSSVPLDGHTLLGIYHDALAYWAAGELLKIRPNQTDLASSQSYMQEYDRLVSRCVETFARLADTKPMRMRGGRYFKGL